MKSAGGTELQVNYLNKYLDLSKYENINLIINQAAFKRIEAKKKNILWCHHYIDQPSIKLLKNAELVKLLDAIVFVSEWQKGEFINHFNLPENKCHVLKNAVNIEPIKENKTNKKIRLIYTSTPWRGLNVLANSIQYLNEKRNDFHLDVYSSTEIYGEKFHNENKANFENFFKQLSQIPNITSHGYVPNNQIISKLKEADIFVYPTTSNETFCIAALEALASGCLTFTTDWGAFKELGENYIELIEFDTNLKNLSTKFAERLSYLMDEYKSGNLNQKLLLQSDYYSKKYSWIKRAEEWKNFLDKFS